MQVLRLVRTLFLVANNTVGDYEPIYIVMAPTGNFNFNWAEFSPILNFSTHSDQKVVFSLKWTGFLSGWDNNRVSGEKEQTFSRILNLEDLNMEENDNINKR